MDLKFREEYVQRLFDENQAMLNSLNELDVESETYADDVQALTEWNKVIVADYKNFGELIEEEERLKHDQKSSKIAHILQAIGIAVTAATFGIGEYNKHQHFKTANKYEEDHAYLTTSDKVAVQDALKTEKKFWQFWK